VIGSATERNSESCVLFQVKDRGGKKRGAARPGSYTVIDDGSDMDKVWNLSV